MCLKFLENLPLNLAYPSNLDKDQTEEVPKFKRIYLAWLSKSNKILINILNLISIILSTPHLIDSDSIPITIFHFPKVQTQFSYFSYEGFACRGKAAMLVLQSKLSLLVSV